MSLKKQRLRDRIDSIFEEIVLMEKKNLQK